MSEPDPDQNAPAPTTPRAKRTLSEKQKQNLAKGQAKLAERRAQQKQERDAARAAAARDSILPTMPETPKPPASRDSYPPMIGGAMLVPADDDRPAPVEQLYARRGWKIGEANGQNGHGEHAPDDVVPPDETNPRHRAQPTFEVPDMAGYDYTPRTLDDLMAVAPLGDGQYYIHVERKTPRVWEGIACAGVQPRVERPITQDDFVAMFGGGEYVLQLYGPPKRGGIIDERTGRARPKALSTPVKYTVPLSVSPPLLFESEDEEDMRPNHYGPIRPGQRPASNAEAKIFETQLSFEERSEERREKREREVVERERSLQAEADRRNMTVAELMLEQAERDAERRERAHERELEREREIAERAQERARANANKPSSEESFAKSLATVLGVMRTNENGVDARQLEQLAENHRRDMDAQRKSHEVELQRQHDRMRDMERLAEERQRDTNARCEERVKTETERAEKRIREVEERAAQRIREVEDASRRQLEDAHRQSETRIGDLRHNHTRDLAAKDESYSMRLETQKASYEMQLSAKNEELTRLRGDVTAARAEADANKDVVGQVKKLKETADALGWNEGKAEEEPKTIGEMLIGLVGQAIANAPEIVASAGETIARARGTSPMTQQQVQHQMEHDARSTAARNYPPRQQQPNRPQRGFQQQPMHFATEEDAPSFAGSGPVRVPAGYPQQPVVNQPQQPLPDIRVQNQPVAPYPEPYQGVAPPTPPQGAPPPQQPSAETQANPQQEQQPAQAAAQPGPPTAPDPNAMMPEEIHRARPMLEQMFQSQVPPAQVAEQLLQVLPIARIRATMRSVPLPKLVAIMSSTPEGAQSPLVRREGQKYLRQIWSILADRVS